MIKLENLISYDIRKCAFKIHKELGPGLFETVYESALTYELKILGYDVKNQVSIPITYADKVFHSAFKLDILVEDLVIVEVKSVSELNKLYFKQLLTYLKLSSKKLGLLINFNSKNLIDKESIIRIANNL